MVLIFDLDDTLFDEMSYVKSGLHAVADFGQNSFGWDSVASFSFMYTYLLKQGRGKVFDEWLKTHGKYSKSHVIHCLNVYRGHAPKISLSQSTFQLLEYYKSRGPLYLVTDGNKNVQQKKIDALGVQRIFNRCYVTHRYGTKHAKPSLFCFEKIREKQKCPWSEMIYVGDNPKKDFVNLNSVGAKTVRVLTGSYAADIALPGFDAQHSIKSLSELPSVLSVLAESDQNVLLKRGRGISPCLY